MISIKQSLFGTLVQLQIIILNRTNSKALFGKESRQRSWLRDWKIFCLHLIFVWKFSWKSDYRTEVNPSGFSCEKPPPFTKGRQRCGFLGSLFVAEIWCKQVVNVQTCGLHRRSMNAPTMLIYKYIYLWPTKINHGYTVGATIGRLFSNYLNCFSLINQQPKQTAKQAVFVALVRL